MFVMTTEQEIELQRLQLVVNEKRLKFHEVEIAYQRYGTENSDLGVAYRQAEQELKEASYAFNNFTGTLPLKKSAG